MSINWVMLSPSTNPPFTPLSGEQTLCTAPPRIGFSLTTPAHFPGKQQPPFSLTHSTGALYLTNRRILYLPDKPTEKFKSFAAPLLNLHDSHVTAPFFGPNVWIALLQPVHGGGIPTPSTGVVELKLTFKEGGAFDFHTSYERVRERLQQVVETTCMDGNGAGSSQAAMHAVNTSNVNLEELPAYQEASDGPLMAPTATAAAMAVSQHNARAPHQQRDSGVGVNEDPARPKASGSGFNAPDDPPPGYEEAQMAGVQNELERRLSEGRE